MQDLKTDIEKMSREELEAVVMNVAGMNTYQFRDLSGKVLCHISTTAERTLLNRIWNNLRELDKYTTFDELVRELQERDYYAERIDVQDFLIMNF